MNGWARVGCVALATSGWLCSAPCRAEASVTVQRWSVAPSCPSQSWFVQQIDTQLANRSIDAASVGVSVRIEAPTEQRGFRLSLAVDTRRGAGRRSLEGATCLEVAEAAAAIVASSLTEASPPPPNAPQTSAPAQGTFSDASAVPPNPGAASDSMSNAVSAATGETDPTHPTADVEGRAPGAEDPRQTATAEAGLDAASQDPAPAAASDDERPQPARDAPGAAAKAPSRTTTASPFSELAPRWAVTAGASVASGLLPNAVIAVGAGPSLRAGNYEVGLLVAGGTVPSQVELAADRAGVVLLSADSFAVRWWQVSSWFEIGALVRLGATRLQANFENLEDAVAWSLALSAGPALMLHVSPAWALGLAGGGSWALIPAEIPLIEATVPLPGWTQPAFGAWVGFTVKRSF